ncbi:hypothetical protein P153DRAFT_405182 [Dothidotthia symphoricarpi CBS 119687]|uniref:Uncharacterized protein n=1 Tax=Dothidotthia symphoricarpi CBS 119687 TaxID=1392245 RepID=A0A6A6ABB1_9PLEO|nr:uncharacterized protein P153DRAFT_405182 [Dothidotthia symphoricarpi CBS 119687]KAF2127991.1 hypothetical protein P153DRAFT_405182 [Dothidotthia symphoricarpi CBS 119687]
MSPTMAGLIRRYCWDRPTQTLVAFFQRLTPFTHTLLNASSKSKPWTNSPVLLQARIAVSQFRALWIRPGSSQPGIGGMRGIGRSHSLGPMDKSSSSHYTNVCDGERRHRSCPSMYHGVKAPNSRAGQRDESSSSCLAVRFVQTSYLPVLREYLSDDGKNGTLFTAPQGSQGDHAAGRLDG